ncbi:MAG TPA: tripartite tricarboxylate transporter substrate-binding protein, partial [Burkholderiaceae bacterium]|nr:tripartite tricarboxylate transporter substrate-binding protein [Burkholderiaceae bacterium]
AGTPREIVARINQEVVRTLADAKVAEQLMSRGLDVVGSTPEAFAAFLRQASDISGRLVREAGIKPE